MICRCVNDGLTQKDKNLKSNISRLKDDPRLKISSFFSI